MKTHERSIFSSDCMYVRSIATQIGKWAGSRSLKWLKRDPADAPPWNSKP